VCGRGPTPKKTADGGGSETPPAAVLQDVQVGRDLISLVVNVARTTAAPRFQSKIQEFLEEYLVSETGPMPFGGRDAELKNLDRWLGDEQAPSRLLITAPAGRGKSALLVRWVTSLQRRGLTERDGKGWHVAFVPISIRVGTHLPSVFYAALATRLSSESLSAPATDAAAYYAEQAAELLRRVPSADRRVLVVIDGIDEALRGGFDPGVFPRGNPPGLKVLLSARLQANDTDASGWLRRLGWEIGVRLETVSLDALDIEKVADVLVKMGAPLDVLSARRPLVKRLTYLSEGEPLLLRYYAEDLWQQREAAERLRVEDLDAMKPGFAAYFERWLDDQEKAWKEEGANVDRRTVDATLAVLACTFGPLEGADLARLVQEVHDSPSVLSPQRLLDPLRRFVRGGSTPGGYVLNHPKIGQYLRHGYLDSSAVWKTLQGFAEWGRTTVAALNQGSLASEHAPGYLLLFHAQHLEEVDGSIDDFMAMVEDGWRRAWQAYEGSFQGFANDVRAAWRAARGDRNTNAQATTAHDLPAEIRCALCLSSICSLGSNTPPDLLPLAVAHSVLSIAQAIHLAEARGGSNRIHALVGLVHHLHEKDLLDLLDSVRSCDDLPSRARYLIAILSNREDGLQI
jgi:hypothetical protein